VIALAVPITSWVWLFLEIGLYIRDRRRGKGSVAGDRGSRAAIVILTFVASLSGAIVAILLPQDSGLRLPGSAAPWGAIGLMIMWVGLIVRVWSIAMLGQAFRTTVEVDADQQVVDRGPYRWVRHPSYTGILIITTGYGIADDNWLSLVIMIVLPLIALTWRITVEERAMISTLGQRYLAYSANTKRLVPGLW
jgi:protein-S-isoprenylcysteine O-methyltransferase Ste14